jgi:hypothetical protein
VKYCERRDRRGQQPAKPPGVSERSTFNPFLPNLRRLIRISTVAVYQTVHNTFRNIRFISVSGRLDGCGGVPAHQVVAEFVKQVRIDAEDRFTFGSPSHAFWP